MFQELVSLNVTKVMYNICIFFSLWQVRIQKLSFSIFKLL
jgi:hypothetical protein